ncbi:hypothetical protein BMS3Abin05_00109 [bacterium BMS3Abin05]|nr:hypothetical protein BMS3Abin05_00109 [bacterium BMS3Abin05]GBE26887.1 hypothetical protein BMS3Bbin03_00807 [bacterium BMS3Bbin03]
MKRVILTMTLILGLFWNLAQAQEMSRVATASAQFLKFGVGARALALGSAYVAFENDPFSLYWNPAGIASIQGTAVAVSRSNYYGGISHNFFGTVLGLAEGALGLSVTYMGTNEIEVTTLSSPDGTGTYYDVSGMSVGLTYARNITNVLKMGITAKLVRERIYRETANALAVDFGSIINTGLGGVKLAMSLTNLGQSMQLRGPDLRVSHDRYPNNPAEANVKADLFTDKWPLPMVYTIGIRTDIVGGDGMNIPSQVHRLTVAFSANDAWDAVLRANYGLEYEWRNLFSIRAGFMQKYDTARFTLGGGVRYQLGRTTMLLDYAYVNYSYLGSTNHFSLEFHY